MADARRPVRYPRGRGRRRAWSSRTGPAGSAATSCGGASRRVTLRDRRQHQRHFAWKPGGFLLDGRPVTLRRPAVRRPAAPAVTASGSVAGRPRPARVAAASRIWVEGRHDAELRRARVGRRPPRRRRRRRADARHRRPRRRRRRVRPVAAAAPRRARRPPRRRVQGVAARRRRPRPRRARDRPPVRRRVGGHPAAGARPRRLAGGPARRAVEGRACAGPSAPTRRASGPSCATGCATYADLRPELVGAVERLIDFVAPP